MKYLNATWLALLLAVMLVPGALLANDDNVHVKGHWIFEIYNADGSFDRRVEFDNALRPSGNSTLIGFLARSASANQWQINVDSVSVGTHEDPCNDATPVPRACILTESTANFPYEFPNLMVGTDNPGLPTKLLLTGSITIGASVALPKEISRVGTYLSSCGPNESPSCGIAFGTLTIFSVKELSTGVEVQPGQTVNITVEISFS